MSDKTNTTKDFDVPIQEHINVILRRKWYFMVPFSLIVTLSSVVTFLIPKTYMSEATIVVQKKNEIDNPMGTGDPISSDKVPAIMALVTSRENLENIIQKVGVARNVVDPVQYESLVEHVKTNLEIKPKGSTLKVSFTGRQPKLCMQIVNIVTGIFSEQDIKLESRYDKTLEFIEKQLRVYERKVMEASDLIRQFREINVDQLPESAEVNDTMIETSKTRMEEIDKILETNKQKIAEIEKRLSSEEENITTFSVSGEAEGEVKEKQLSPLERKLKELNDKLESLLVTFTDKYPEVRKVKEEIALAKEQLLESYAVKENKRMAEREVDQADALSIHMTTLNPVYVKLNKELDDAKKEQMSLKQERNKLIENISQANENLRAIPRHEQELKSLNQDLDAYQEIYNQLQQRYQETKLRKEMELWGRGTYFKVVSPASLPLHPIAPQMWKMITIGIILGGLIGVSAAFWAEFMDHSIRDLESAKDFFKVPILAAIPKVYVDVEIVRKRRLNMFLFVMGSFYVIFIVILITREILLQVAPEILEFQTYKDMLNQFLQTLGIATLT